MRFTPAVAAVSLAASVIVGAGVVTASPALAVSCPDNGWSILDGRIGHFFNGNGINIRTGPSSSQCTAVGQGQASHTVQLDCWKSGENGTWSHLFDFTTGKEGWSKDSLLVGNGANIHC